MMDNKKMWESILRDKSTFYGITVADVLNALIEQGLTTNDNGEIVSIEPEQEKSHELTEFEKVLAECINTSRLSVISSEAIAVSWSETLVKEVRKQIASEINVEELCKKRREGLIHHRNEVTVYMVGYKDGIKDTLKAIGGE